MEEDLSSSSSNFEPSEALFQACFDRVVEPLKLEQDLRAHWGNWLYTQHLSQPRIYHGARHALRVAARARRFAKQTDSDATLAGIAGFFHDAVWGRSDGFDEKMSAGIASVFMEEAGCPDKALDVQRAVLATCSHKQTTCVLEACVIDADLWGLSGPLRVFLGDFIKVRDEAAARQAFLGTFTSVHELEIKALGFLKCMGDEGFFQLPEHKWRDALVRKNVAALEQYLSSSSYIFR